MYKLINLFLLITIILLTACGSSQNPEQKNDPEQINLKLEQIEDQVRLAIQQGDQAKALELANQLVHPSHVKWKTKPRKEIFGFRIKFYYDEYWLEKRNIYKDQIIAMTNNTANLTNNKANQEESIKTVENLQADDSTNTNSAVCIGEWTGTFGENQINLVIESIDDGLVQGYNSIQGKNRILKGLVDENNYFELREPGDEEWDGVFKFKIENNQAVGKWNANNGKLTIDFTLTVNKAE